jgi:hypothetical protein
MKIALRTLATLFILSACAQAVPTIPSLITVESLTLTKTVEMQTPSPTRTPWPSPTSYPTLTEWVKVYPTKKALVIYGSSWRNEYTINFIEWGDFYLEPYMILYEDGQLILTNSFLEKQLSQAETQTIVAKLEQLGFPIIQEAYESNPDALFNGPADLDYSPLYPYIHITLNEDSLKLIIYRKDQEQHLIQPMTEIISYLNSFTSSGATPYQPDRLLVAAGDVEQIPEGETAIPWPEEVPSPLHRSYYGVFYLEGNEALKLYKAAGENRFAFFSFEGKNYAVYLRPILPHECHIYHYSEVNLPPPAQPSFLCDDW